MAWVVQNPNLLSHLKAIFLGGGVLYLRGFLICVMNIWKLWMAPSSHSLQSLSYHLLTQHPCKLPLLAAHFCKMQTTNAWIRIMHKSRGWIHGPKQSACCPCRPPCFSAQHFYWMACSCLQLQIHGILHPFLVSTVTVTWACESTHTHRETLKNETSIFFKMWGQVCIASPAQILLCAWERKWPNIKKTILVQSIQFKKKTKSPVKKRFSA